MLGVYIPLVVAVDATVGRVVDCRCDGAIRLSAILVAPPEVGAHVMPPWLKGEATIIQHGFLGSSRGGGFLGGSRGGVRVAFEM